MKMTGRGERGRLGEVRRGEERRKCRRQAIGYDDKKRKELNAFNE
jgi:hypothetical protein